MIEGAGYAGNPRLTENPGSRAGGEDRRGGRRTGTVQFFEDDVFGVTAVPTNLKKGVCGTAGTQLTYNRTSIHFFHL